MVKYIVALMSANTDINRPPYSEYWRILHKGFLDATLNDDQIELEIICPNGKYHDYGGILKEGADRDPDYLVTAFSQENLVRSALKGFKNKIVAIDVPPSQSFINDFKGRILGHIGTNPTLLGMIAGEQLMKHEEESFFDCCLVIMHDQRGHLWKYDAIKRIAQENGFPIASVYLKDDPPMITLPDYLENDDLGVIALSTKGIEAAEKCINPNKLARLVGVDINEHVVNLLEQKKMACTIIQEPYRIGPAAISMILKEPLSYKNVFIEPTIAERSNARIILNCQERYL